MRERNGYAVAIRRENGTEFLASSGHGILPAVWTLAQLRYAVVHKKNCIADGFKARVVRVTFTEPQIVEKEVKP